jgi:hypothetical protein
MLVLSFSLVAFANSETAPQGPVTETPGSDQHNGDPVDEDPPAEEEDPPAEEEDPPAEEEDPPAEEEDPPAEEEDPPADEEDPPADEEDPPADEEDSPADEEDPPADEEDPPVDEEDPPADEEDPPADEEDPPVDDPAAEVSGDGFPNGGGGNGQSQSEYILEILHGSVGEVTEYDWNIDGELTDEEFEATVTRSVGAFSLNVYLYAQIQEGVNLDEVQVQLGVLDNMGEVDQEFVPVYKFTEEPINIEVADGMQTFELDLSYDRLEYDGLLTKIRILVPVGETNNGSIMYVDDTT